MTAPTAAMARVGEMELRNWQNAEGTIRVPVMKVRWDVSTFFQEPCSKYNFYYESLDDFTKVMDITFRAQVTAGGVPQDAYVTYSPLVDEPGKWGWDVTGCGNWDSFFISDSGANISEEVAKGYFRAGIGLTNLEIIEIDTEQFTSNDPEYNQFLGYLGRAYPIATMQGGAEKSPVDDYLPKDFTGLPGDNLWATRQLRPISARRYALPGVVRAAGGGSCDGGMLLWKQQWNYAGYEHLALQQNSGDAYVDEQKVVITIAYSAPTENGYRQMGSRRYHVTLGQRDGFVVADRFRNAGSQPLQFDVRVYCEQPEEEEPLAALDEEDPLEAALEEVLNERLAETIANQDQGTQAVYDGYDAARAYEEYLRSPEYAAEQERLRREREAARAAARAAEMERLQRGLENGLRITSPASDTQSDRNVYWIEGNVHFDDYMLSGADVYLSINGQKQQFEIQSNGNFRTAAVLGAGNNHISLVGEMDGARAEDSRDIYYTGRRSRLRVTLTWDGPGDIDLHLTDPNGTEISYSNKQSGTMSLDVDNTQSFGPENITVPDSVYGSYRISVVNYSGASNVTATVHVFVDERLEDTFTRRFYGSRGEEWAVTTVPMN